MNIVFFGTPPFAAQTLDFLLQNGVEVAAVVTKPDKPKGRSGTAVPTAVKKMIEEKYPHIPIYQPALISSPGESDILLPYQADLFVVVAYGEIIKQHLLDMPRLGCINVHASLLPKYRGAAPIQQAIINGENESGITIMYMVRKMDAGDMIKKIAVPISPEISFGQYEQLLCEAGKLALLDTILSFESGEPPRTAQDHSLATSAPKIELENCEIDWRRSSLEIHNLVRGVNPYPGAWCFVNIKGLQRRMKVWQTTPLQDRRGCPGEILESSKGELIIGCGEGALRILTLQLEGKKEVAAEDFLRGIPRSSLEFFSGRDSGSV